MALGADGPRVEGGLRASAWAAVAARVRRCVRIWSITDGWVMKSGRGAVGRPGRATRAVVIRRPLTPLTAPRPPGPRVAGARRVRKSRIGPAEAPVGTATTARAPDQKARRPFVARISRCDRRQPSSPHARARDLLLTARLNFPNPRS